MSKYDDIINYNYVMKHERMSIGKRSAEFSPFSALTGYSDLIYEKGRITEEKKDLSIDAKELLDIKLNIVNKNIINKPIVKITYFIKDNKKSGGKYETIIDSIKKIDFIKKNIILSDKKAIKIDDILEIESQDINFNDIEL